MKRALRVAAWLVLFWGGLVYGQQVDCSNIGFEEGTTKGWTLTNGTVALNAQLRIVYTNEVNGTYDNGHFITRLSNGNDPNITAEKIPMVAPGSNYSIRIGNSSAQRGSHFDRIKTSFLVTAENTLFQYKFAVVLQKDAKHESYQKPGFNLLIYDETKTPLPCSYYDIQLSTAGTAAGFKTQGDLEYRNWTTGAIDLRNYIGKVLTVEVTAHGCTEKGHYGYAYFDAQCLKSEIKAASVCPDANGDLTLLAPEGFEKYKWNTGETTTSIKIKPKLGDNYFVKLVPYSSLNESCELQLDYQVKHQKADTTIVKTICEGEKYTVGNMSYQTTGTHITKIDRGNTCDSTVTLHLTVRPTARYAQNITICEGQSLTVGTSKYSASGTYVTVISRPSLCDSIVTTMLTVEKFNVTLSTPSVTVSEGDSVQLIASVSPSDDYLYRWEPAENLSCPTCPATWAKPTGSTRYTVYVTDANKTCQKIANARIMVNHCGIYTPDIFSPNNDQKNDIFFIQANTCIKQIREMVIYNRWGEVIFLEENFPASDPAYGWDGTYLEKSLGPGTFPYKITVQFADEEMGDYTYRGVVILMK
ncbi:MAG: gliding motility-associated C-terminal domain-containing protein [Spirosomataceae bacterium]